MRCDKQRQDQIVSFTDIPLAYDCHIFLIRINHRQAFVRTAEEIVFAPWSTTIILFFLSSTLKLSFG